MNVPARRIKVTTDVPNTTYTVWDENAHKFVPQDEWAFDFVVFYAHDRQKIPPRDWNERNFNEWFLFVHERKRSTGETRVIHLAPEYTTDGRVKGVHILLRPTPDPEAYRWTVQQYKAEEWPLKMNKLKAYGRFFHFELLKMIQSPEWKETYLYGIPPFDSNQFCINFANFFHNMGLIDDSDVRYLASLTRTQWPRLDGSTLPYRI
ncbi:unnamed protein product [Rhizoctonia solani]|uniref:Uncharacterized protein n=1 Tax=Rhizoctonia solani TaxID=456999 RepID=A0A8H2WSJ1_9AGAM|nr:unnamed protein product [Rhizoctonia solani]